MLHLVVIISLLFLASALAGTSTRVIYVDQDKGSLDPNCWTGGMNLPCKSYHLAEKGALLLKNKFNDIVEIIPRKNASCESYTWMYDSNDTCKCGKNDSRVRCSYDHGDVHVSILDCSCMTYDEETACVTIWDNAHMDVDKQLIAQMCTIHYPRMYLNSIPKCVADITETADFVASVRMVPAPWFIPMIYSA